jgi:DNA phosphorothioation-dependent restriction protein DptH
VRRVAASYDDKTRTITADRAVEMREAKQGATLLLIDTLQAGAGMDGIYNAARDVDEQTLFKEAVRLAGHEVTRVLSSADRSYAEQAIKTARGHGRRYSVSPWTEFDFLARIAASGIHPGHLLYLVGLWPVEVSNGSQEEDGLDISRVFVDRLLGTTVSGLTPTRRIEALRLLNASDYQLKDLEQFLRSASTKPLLPALADLADKPHLWVNALRMEGSVQVIQGIDLLSWRNNTGRIARWSGLIEEEIPRKEDIKEPPVLILKTDADRTGDYSRLEVKWKTRPDRLEKDAVEYHVAIISDMDEELAA